MADNDYFDDNDENLILPSQSVFQAYRSLSPPHQAAVDSSQLYSNNEYPSTSKNQDFSHKNNFRSSNESGNLFNNNYKNASNIMDIPISTIVRDKSQNSNNNYNSPVTKIDRSAKKPFLKKGR